VIANTRAADLTQGDKFWHQGQLYRVSVNVRQDENERKIYAYYADGPVSGLVVIFLPGGKVVPVQQEDAPPE
jgi:hypothetical protein